MNLITRPLTHIGRTTVSAVEGIGYAGRLLVESLYFAAFGWRTGQPMRPRAVLEQMRQIGVDALPIVTMMSFTIGIMLGIQFIAKISNIGAQQAGLHFCNRPLLARVPHYQRDRNQQDRPQPIG